MKTIKIIFVVAFAISFLPNNANAQDAAGAVKYLDELRAPLGSIKNDTWKYLRAVLKSKNPKRIEKERNNLLSEFKNAHVTIESKAGYYDDLSLKEALMQYLDISYKVLSEDYDQILDMQEIIEQSYDMMEAYILAQEEAGNKLNDASEDLSEAEEQFASKYNVILQEQEEDKITKHINKANAALGYYNDIYLIFYRCNFQESYAIDAITREDVNAIQQNINAQLSYSEEGLDKLKEIDAFQGDTKLKYAAKSLLNFYQDEAEDGFPQIIDFYIKQDNFDRVNKKFSALKKRKRKQKDVDEYNKAVNDYNKAIDTFNKVNETLNKKREKYLDAWNGTTDDFFDKHVD